MDNRYLELLSELQPPKEADQRFTCVSLFTGGGGLDLGLEAAGFHTALASDIERALCDTIDFNLPRCRTLAADVHELKGRQIKRDCDLREVDLVAGGPPCQAFSILGQRNSFDDPRGALVYEFVRLIRELEPRAFVFENVPGLLTVNGGRDWAELVSCFEKETQYRLYPDIVNSADFGVPQIRKRVIVVGFRDNASPFVFPQSTHQETNRAATQYDQGKPEWHPSHLAFEGVEGLPNQRIRPHGQRVRERYAAIIPGTRDRVDHTDRIDPARPSGTVLVGSRAGGGRPFIHPFEPRHITVREAARLQSFPDWYVFANSETWQYRAVGNAVPPLLARALGREIAKHLGG